MKLKNVLLLLSFFASLGGFAQTTDTSSAPQYHLMPGIVGGEYITFNDLQNLSPLVVLKATEGNYQLASFMVIVIPKRGEVRVYNVEGNILPPALLADIKKRNEGDKLLIDQVRVKNPTNGDTKSLGAAVYTVVKPDFKNNFMIGFDGATATSDMRKKNLVYMGNDVKIAYKYEKDNELQSFTITLIPNNDDILATNYQVTGSVLSNELLEKIKALPVGSTIIFHDIRITPKVADSAATMLSPAKYIIIE